MHSGFGIRHFKKHIRPESWKRWKTYPRYSTATSHRSRGIGHNVRRKINALSFHSLRRTATTLLHEAGVPSTVAQALIGHDSEEIHSDYISIGREALLSAVNLFPTL